VRFGTFDLADNNFDDEGVAIAVALGGSTKLRVLSLGNYNIRSPGICAITEALKKNKTFTVLNLNENNHIGDKGAEAFLNGNNSLA
jgi:hypothetical protein